MQTSDFEIVRAALRFLLGKELRRSVREAANDVSAERDAEMARDYYRQLGGQFEEDGN